MRPPILLALVLVAGAARAQDLYCRNGDFPSGQESFGLARATGPGRLYVLRDLDGCPNEAPACRDRAYVLPGHVLLTGRDHGAYVCAFIPNRVGGAAGWVRRDRLTALPPAPAPPLEAWIGEWSYGDNSLSLSRRGTALKVEGEAYWPSATPSPDLPGGPHTGEIEGVAIPEGDHAQVTDMHWDGCKARLALVGRFLVASDSGQCGGANVSFDGVYRRGR